ncbi:odorant receptor 131-2-like [Gadus chalcogrammus]|uniref:odorant receptor 131-2-like n=1 Tax=Gadus chalcogrammus TaxID=1042646 RepID=UPI0024C363A1|nr:odorant receptor 131-2-like [Gadus chalcogrammus]
MVVVLFVLCNIVFRDLTVLSAMQSEGFLRVNVSGSVEYQASQEMIVFCTLSVVLSCSFIYVNCVLLYTLRSKPVFCETSRYILLFNLLFADTAYLVTSLLLYILAACRLRLKLYVCGLLTSIGVLEDIISPLTLAVMSLERYVAVCFPMRHTDLATVRNTGAAIAAVWTISGGNVLMRVLILIGWKNDLDLNVEMKDFCSKEAMFLAPISSQVDKAFSIFVFAFGGLVTILSYVGVTLVARSASTEKATASKAGKTVLLHMIQLVLILIATIYSSILLSFARTVDRTTLIRLYNSFYVCLNIFPRCLSALIYGLRDKTIRPVLLKRLCGQLKCLAPT